MVLASPHSVAAEAPAPSPSPARPARMWLVFGLLFLIAAIGATLAARDYGRRSALETLAVNGRIESDLKAALLRAVLERPRVLPLVLSQSREVTDMLGAPSAAGIAGINRKLEGLVRDTGASVIYVIAADGRAIASSNWREPTSFVGNDYSFRDYFKKAMADGHAEHFALGSVSRRPGLYISRRVGPAEAPLGVAVVKTEFDALEADWRATGRPTFVADRRGVVLITSLPSWRFMTVAPISPADRAAIRDSLQFGDAPLEPLPFERRDEGELRTALPGESEADYLELTVPVATTGWSLRYLQPVQPAVSTGIRSATQTALSALSAVFLLAALIIWRRQVVAARLTRAATAQAELERRVSERTRELTTARDLLAAEISQHRTTDERLKGVQSELVAANRLAILGQVAAGVAHEINQPVATIRAYADNARTFLDRGQQGQATENLQAIAGLTERIGTITEDLKSLARKGRGATEAVAIDTVLDGAVLLLGSRFSGRLDAIDIALPRPAPQVMGNRIRLEQVFINLLQNAMEALDGAPGGHVRVTAEPVGSRVIVRVADNGPGLPEAIHAQLFSPFNTSKERGLGLGLVITKEILADFGATIAVESSPAGTTFILDLAAATSGGSGTGPAAQGAP
ncbi:two-component system, NtrC family, C4-dicarboxylate transport sensor histidine kinase DctB [Rhizobium sp. RU20A]|nr:two-component system, NtrC family, C4-dicarboxylate transport sensor histidine kinase DctB [Rhizobium sp. RU20A]